MSLICPTDPLVSDVQFYLATSIDFSLLTNQEGISSVYEPG